MIPGDKVRLIENPSRIGILGNETDGPPNRLRMLVHFIDGDEQFVLKGALEKIETTALGPYEMIATGRYGHVQDLRGLMTYYRLSGKLANLIYSLNITNTQFLAYQFKPVLNFLASPCSGILIADEVGLGKTIEAGLIWTELRARQEAKRLLVVCPAMLREKWQLELSDRFGVKAEIVDAGGLLNQLTLIKDRPHESFALIVSMQGLRPPKNWDDEEDLSQSSSAKLARFLNDSDFTEAMIDMVIIDEAHYLRNPETQTYKLGELLRPVTQNLVLLSATPIQLRSRDLFTLLHLLDEDAFPYEYSFERTLQANAPIIQLRDKVLNSVVTQEDFLESIQEALLHRFLDDNEQLNFLKDNPPTEDDLESPAKRSELADKLDKINPLAKVITRTLKRDVQEFRVQRNPVSIKVHMSDVERYFYDAITNEVRDYCHSLDIPTGFMMTSPQREMSSSMAAAFRGWRQMDDAISLEEADEVLYENYGSEISDLHAKPRLGPLLTRLVDITQEIGSFSVLYEEDSKYLKLWEQLSLYWRLNPGKKVVLFSFYRKTLQYLGERLKKDGVPSVIVYGGMDKHAALAQFKDVNGPNILLSSEVASEGVDLQFSSLLINYDLPWNPMRIEQRIGRIDRIGQEAEQILIWNFVYADTIDERVYDRLLDRLNIFQRALGSIEAILGDEIQQLARELLSHKLTPEQEIIRIERARVAIENVNRQQETLENEATQLIAHGDFIQNQVRAAKELGRYVTGENLYAYAKDYLVREFPGTRFTSSFDNQFEVNIDLSVEATISFAEFLAANRLQSSTKLLTTNKPKMLFENKVGKTPPTIEKVTQEHPLIRFVAEQIKRNAKGVGYHPVSAIDLHHEYAQTFEDGDYVYAVSRWTISGSREIERLEYVVFDVNRNTLITGDQAEHLVNIAAMLGEDWLAVRNLLDHSSIANIFEECKIELDHKFVTYSGDCLREDKDRINMMVNQLTQRMHDRKNKAEFTISNIEISGSEKQKKILPAMRKKIENEVNSIQAKIDKLRLKERAEVSESFVSGGVIHIR